MSYILDALDKSEKERERKQPPRLTSVHHKPRAPSGRLGRWLTGLFILAILNTALIWYWMPGSTTPHQATGTQEPTPASAQAMREVSQPVRPVSLPKDELITPPAVRAIQPVRVSELPTHIQRQIPDLSFSSHIFSSHPSLRSVTINGRNLREGDSPAAGLTIMEITEEGVVLRYLHYVIEMSVIRDWAFD